MLGDAIKRAREIAGLSQRELAKLIGVSGMSISKYESNAMNPTPEHAIKLAEVLLGAVTRRYDALSGRTEALLDTLERGLYQYRDSERDQ